MSTTADAARAYVTTTDAYDALPVIEGPEERQAWAAHVAAMDALTEAAGFDVGSVEAIDMARLLVREVDRYEALLAAVRDVGRLSCAKIPDGVPMKMDEWRRALCGECPSCRMHKAAAELDGTDWKDFP
jgi:hypothetical protein